MASRTLLDFGIGEQRVDVLEYLERAAVDIGSKPTPKYWWTPFVERRTLGFMQECEARTDLSNDMSRVVDALPGLVWTALPDGDIDFLNQRWCEYTGLSATEAQGRGWQGAVHPDDLALLLERWPYDMSGGKRGEMEARLRRFDGEYHWFLFRTFPLADSSGRVEKWCGMNTDIDDRHRAEKDLRAIETNYSEFVESFPGLVVTMNMAGKVELFSSEVLEYFGKTREELRTWQMNDAVHPDDLPRVTAAFTESVSTGTPYSIEHRCRRADGVYRWFQVRALAVRDENRQITGWYVVLTDIDDLKRAAEAVRANELNFQLTVESIPGMVHTMTATGGVEFVNHQILDFFGKSFEELNDWGMLVHPDDRSRVVDLWTRSVTTGQPFDVEHRVLRADGTYRWLHARGLPLRDVSGNIVRWYNLLTDIDERKRAEMELRRAYDSFADAQRLSKTGSFITDLVGDDHTWSEEAYRIFEFDPATKVSVQRIRDIIHPDDLPAFESVIARGMSGVNVNFAFRIVTARGIKHVRGIAHVIEEIEGRPMFIGALQDVTESMVAEEALNVARSELAHVARVTTLSTLTASMAHEVNQPLSGIITNASTCLRMLDADPPNVDGARETARRTIRDGNRASDVVTRLRALFSKKEFMAEPLDLNEATREVIALSLSELQRNRAIIQSELADDLPPVRGDRVQLQQVILNLLRNASDAMAGVDDRPRQLTIRTGLDEEDRVRLSVQDVGVGIEPEDVDKVFAAFYTTKRDGMGIGLSVSRSIIESHHGRLSVASNDGPGATFSFSIPRSFDGEHVIGTT